MIEITRTLVRQLQTVFQRALGRATRAHAGPLVFFHAGPEGLNIRATGLDTAIEYHLAGNFEPALFAVPLSVLAECEGRQDDPVRIELAKGKLHFHWQDGSVPRSKQVAIGKLPTETFPPAPDTMADVEPGILNALRDAAEISDTESSRYALGCLQLSGTLGQIAATDGRHLLVQSGFQFPWTEELLVPASKVFGSRELPADQPVRIGRTEKYVALSAGPWTIHLAVNRDGRFPRVDDVVPAGLSAASRLQLHPVDSRFLLDTIGRLPGNETLNHPITFDLNGQVILRARSEGEPRPTEVILTNSQLEGDPVRLHSNREFLARAARLGFREFCLFGSAKPVLAQDANRRYVWIGLDAEGAVPPTVDAIRIESPPATKSSSIRHIPIKEPNVTQSIPTADAAPTAKTKPQQRLEAAGQKTSVEQAIELRDALQAAARQAHELARSLKRHRRQNRLVETTLASLKQFQAAG